MNARAALVFLLMLIAPAAAQAAPLSAQDPLYKAIAAADAALFAASNSCDLETLGRYIADDLEFYHDRSGLSVGKADLLQKTKDNICGKMVRELVPARWKFIRCPVSARSRSAPTASCISASRAISAKPASSICGGSRTAPGCCRG